MPIKDVLALLEPDPKSDAVDKFARSFALKMGAHLTAVQIVERTEVSPVFLAGAASELLIADAQKQKLRAEKNGAEFLDRASTEGLSADAYIIDETPFSVEIRFKRLTRHFDLTILRQPDPNRSGDKPLFLEAALFESGRPVIVVPHVHRGPAGLDSIAIAWDGSSVAARAVGDAMPLLRRAKLIDIVTVSNSSLDLDNVQGFDILPHLERHGLQARTRHLSTSVDVTNTLLNYVADEGTQLLVMGGYGHSRFRELVLGGATRGILSSMTVPVLLSH